MHVEPCSEAESDAWQHLRAALWPEGSRDEHFAEIQRMLSDPARYAAFIAYDQAKAIGFAEASLRYDYVNGCATSPVVFLEGVYVVPEHRRKGTARLLIAAVERWGAANGCAEIASDALLQNVDSHRMHAALGFRETERVVYFCKPLTRPAE